MTGRPGLEIGENGEIWVRPDKNGKYRARTRVRDTDGVTRDVTATADTRGGASRELRRKLAARSAPRTAGVSAAMTVNELADYWLGQRKRSGVDRGHIKPQTLAAYEDTVRLLIRPAMGGLRVRECTVGRLEETLGALDDIGQSTAQARSVLSQMLALAARHQALTANPMTLVERPPRTRREIEVLTAPQAHLLRAAVRPDSLRIPGRRGPNHDLADVIDGLLGTGCRIGELLALTWVNLNLDSDEPTVRVCGTLVEPRSTHVLKLHRQESTKSQRERTLLLPGPAVEMLRRRHRRPRPAESEFVFASRTGTPLWPNNMRTRLRAAVASNTDLVGTTPHTLRRTVGTLVAHRRGLDAAREQLGHSDPSVTYQHYVAPAEQAPDLRDVLADLFA